MKKVVVQVVLKVYNKYKDYPIPVGSVYVGRPTVWGNPYPMYNEDERDAVCDLFEKYAIERLKEDSTWLEPLKDKHLVCFCSPKRCHADTLLRLANTPKVSNVKIKVKRKKL